MRRYNILPARKATRNTGNNRHVPESAVLEDLLKMTVTEETLRADTSPDKNTPVASVAAIPQNESGTGPDNGPRHPNSLTPTKSRPRRVSNTSARPAASDIVISTRRASLAESMSSDAPSIETTSSDDGTMDEDGRDSGEMTTPVARVPHLGPLDFSTSDFSFDAGMLEPILTPHLLANGRSTIPPDISEESDDETDVTEAEEGDRNSDSRSALNGYNSVGQYHEQIRKASQAAQAAAATQNSTHPSTSSGNGAQSTVLQTSNIATSLSQQSPARNLQTTGWQTFASYTPTPTARAAIDSYSYFDQPVIQDSPLDPLTSSDSSGSNMGHLAASTSKNQIGMIRQDHQHLNFVNKDLASPRGLPNHPLLQQVAQAKAGHVLKSPGADSPKAAHKKNMESSTSTEGIQKMPSHDSETKFSPSLTPFTRPVNPSRPSLYTHKSQSMMNLRAVPPIAVSKEIIAPDTTVPTEAAAPKSSPKPVTSPAKSSTSRRLSLPSLTIASPDYYAPAYYTTQINRSTGRSQQIHARPDEGSEELPQYSCDVHMEGWAQRKMEFLKPGQPAQQRPWKRVYVYLHGPSIKIFKTDPRVSAPPGDAHPYRDFKPDYFKTSVPAQNISIPRAPDADMGDNGDRDNGSKSSNAMSHIPLVSSLSKASGSGNICLRHYSLQSAESGLAADYHKRKHVVRVRAEGEQFLLQVADDRNVVEWIEALQGGTNISKDLDAREQPKFITLPRRRRRRATEGNTQNPLSTSVRRPAPRGGVNDTVVRRRTPSATRSSSTSATPGETSIMATAGTSGNENTRSNMSRMDAMLAEEQDDIVNSGL